MYTLCKRWIDGRGVCERERERERYSKWNRVMTSQRICFVPMTNGLSNQRNCNAVRPHREERIRPIQYFSEGRRLGWFFYISSFIITKHFFAISYIKNKSLLSTKRTNIIFQYTYCNTFTEYTILYIHYNSNSTKVYVLSDFPLDSIRFNICSVYYTI